MDKLKIKYVDIDSINPYENNPRNNEKSILYVVESIKKFGFKNPIILDKDNLIICGHTRFEAARKIKIKEVPCIYAEDLTEEQIKRFRILDNKVAEYSHWNYDLLNTELEKILNIDMEKFGFLKNQEIDIAEVDLDEYFTQESNEKKIICPKCGYEGSVEEFDTNSI